MKYSKILLGLPVKDAIGLKSWFGPYVFLLENEQLPQCKVCEKKLSPIFQIEVSQLREFFSFQGHDLYLQVFYCANEKCDEYGSMDDQAADNFLVRMAKSPALTLSKGSLDFATHNITLGPQLDDSESEPTFDDKIGGFPAWVQEESYSHCPECRNNRNMEYRLQFNPPESEGLPFPNGAAIFISQCKIHHQQFGFIWQCT